jgi:hypothetical protein
MSVYKKLAVGSETKLCRHSFFKDANGLSVNQ